MSSYTLNVKVEGGNISSDYSVLTADSVEYITAIFNFDVSWSDLVKTAVFRVGELVYHLPLENDTCKIPHEVLKEPCMFISVFGVKGKTRATTTELMIQVQNSGYVVCEPSAPTPDPYNYFIERVSQLKDEALIYSDKSRGYAEDAAQTEQAISSLTKNAVDASAQASESRSDARNSANLSSEALQRVVNIENLLVQKSEEVEQNASISVGAAENAQKAAMEQVENHNKNDNFLAHPNIVEIAENAKSIALGKANSLCFETEEQLRNWVAGNYLRQDGKTIADLKIGDNLYILELGVPDYWWDGVNVQPLGAEKPDFSDYYTKNQIDARITNASFEVLSRSEYNILYQNGELDSGKIYFVEEE